MELERAIVDYTQAVYTDLGMSHSDFARAAFGDEEREIVRWRKIRNRASHGKPQRLTAADVGCIARALNKRPSELFLVEQMMSK